MENIVTSYQNPDLDGVAASYAYAEFLNKTNKIAGYFIDGKKQLEVDVVLNYFNIELDNKNVNFNNDIILVDTSSPNDISKDIILDNVIEVIDHREITEVEKFVNAKVQVELVGAAATLIVEKFYNSNIKISEESAILLYYAIASNTINFKASITTKRDIEMAKWLQKQYPDKLNEDIIKLIFKEKSKLEKPLKKALEADLKLMQSLAIAQLEIVDVKGFIDNNITEIKEALLTIKKDYNLKYVFLNCIDTFAGYSTYMIADIETEKMLSKVLNIKFDNGIFKTDNIVMRKELVPLF